MSPGVRITAHKPDSSTEPHPVHPVQELLISTNFFDPAVHRPLWQEKDDLALIPHVVLEARRSQAAARVM